MFCPLLVVLYLWGFVQTSKGESRCAVVIYVNQSSFNSDAEIAKYVENIHGLSSNLTNVYISSDPDLFTVRHGRFINAPGLFALEPQKFPGMFLRRKHHRMVLEHEQSTEDFQNDATFLMDHVGKRESYTTLKLFSHRSWKLSAPPEIDSPLFFDDYKNNNRLSQPSELLIVAQPCPKRNNKAKYQVVKSEQNLQTPAIPNVSRGVAAKPTFPPTDATLSGNTNAEYLTAFTTKGSLKSIPNEYSFDNYQVPKFIMSSLVENARTAGDGVESPKPESKPVTAVENRVPPEANVEHTNKPPSTKQKITDLYNILDEPDVVDIQKSLRDLQYGSTGCKLLIAEDTMGQDAAYKDTVANPETKKECMDEFPEACAEIAKKRYCLAFKSLMSSICRKSCNLCPRLLDTGFTTCTKTCGGGRQLRMIKVNRREYLQTRHCNSHLCPNFDEYKYESRNIVTPQVVTSHEDEPDDFSYPSGKLLYERERINNILKKMNLISPQVNDQLFHEQNFESSLKGENAKADDTWTFTGREGSDDIPGKGDDLNTQMDNNGYSVETIPDR